MTDRQILIVDDEKNIRMTMTRALEPLGLPVHTAVNGEDALEKLSEGEFALVFLDLKMNGIDGVEVLRRINEAWPATRVIVISAHGTIGSAVEVMKLGAVDFLEKPFSPVDVREHATAVLEREELDEQAALHYPALIEVAKRYVTDRSFDAARACVLRAVAVDPGQPEAYNLLGALLEIRGDWLEAQKYYRAALDIDPTFKPARANLERTTSRDKRGKINLGPDAEEEGQAGDPGRSEV